MAMITKAEPMKLHHADYIVTTSKKRIGIVHLNVNIIFKMRAAYDPAWADEAIRRWLRDTYCIHSWEIETIHRKTH